MKAFVCTGFGGPEDLQLRELPAPVPADDELLIRVGAASVNASDWELLSGKPLYGRLYRQLNRHIKILGSDIAGRVAAVGKDVTQFQVGDAVFGDIFDRMGGFAEYALARQANLARIPEGMSFEEAAAVPQAAVIAMQGIYSDGQVQAGERVLINGAGGGAGTFAIQLAKHFGAEVTAVDHGRKLDLLRSLGADQVIDYTQTDFTKMGKQYNLILELASHHSLRSYKRALAANGRCLVVGGSTMAILQALLADKLNLLQDGKRLRILAWESNRDLAYLIELLGAGVIRPVIDGRFSFEQTPAALAYLGAGKALGKVVIIVNCEVGVSGDFFVGAKRCGETFE